MKRVSWYPVNEGFKHRILSDESASAVVQSLKFIYPKLIVDVDEVYWDEESQDWECKE